MGMNNGVDRCADPKEKQYKNGDRKGPNAIAMQAQLMALSDEDLQVIARYYSSQAGLGRTDDQCSQR